jgi:hypothetical protein
VKRSERSGIHSAIMIIAWSMSLPAESSTLPDTRARFPLTRLSRPRDHRR